MATLGEGMDSWQVIRCIPWGSGTAFSVVFSSAPATTKSVNNQLLPLGKLVLPQKLQLNVRTRRETAVRGRRMSTVSYMTH